MLLAVLFLGLSTLRLAASPPIEPVDPPDQAAWPASVSGNSLTATVFTDSGETLTIDITNLDLHGTVPTVILRYPLTSESARVSLLRYGAVSLVDEAIATDDERAAQTEAREARQGVWATTAPSSTAPPSTSTTTVPAAQAAPVSPGLLDRIGDWLSNNWQYWLGGVGGIAFVVGGMWRAVTNARRRRHEHRHDVVVFGRPGAGKTSFIKTLQSRAPRLEKQPTMRGSTYDLNSPILYGKHSFHLRMVDNAGMDSGRMLDDFNRGRKSVIVLILAHNELADDTKADKSAYQAHFIQQQLGYCSFVTSLIEARTLQRKPDLVVVFITKFDHLSDHAPTDSASKETTRRLLDAFDSHLAVIKRACDSRGVPFDSIVGSSSKQWGFTEFDHEIQKLARI